MKWRKVIFFILICLHFSFTLHAQSKWSSFLKLSRPEKWWTMKHLFIAGKAFKMTGEARKVTNTIFNDSILDQYISGGRTDAFRHGYWMARMSSTIGEKKARSLGKAHEKGNYLGFLKGITEEGLRSDSIGGIMDLRNNEVGIRIGKKERNASPENIKIEIISAIQRGEFYILKRNISGEFLDCSGNPVAESSVWYLPYCLISSDLRP
jgi:hypothetical protein